MLKILLPENGEKAYEKAALAFQTMYKKVTGEMLPLIIESTVDSDLIVIGSDAVNEFTAQAFAEGWIDSFGIRYGTDDYALRSVERNGHTYLFLAGGRGRSTMYAVYDFFERVVGCHYYWDGDVIPHADQLPIGGLCVTEQPRFEYRGLRYFAHRGLHRYQAEHWSLDDWKQEIDWMIKRRLNFFMLRIGLDDLYQRAFPDVVDYPNASERLPEAKGDSYDDRTLFWSLEYRGLLRKKLLKYAFDYDLIHSEDCGTMTHWYSRTPIQYLEKKHPKLLSQTTASYNEQTGLCWDPRDKENMDNYMKLTDTHVRDFGRPEMFHTIGLAERMIYEDHAKNMNMKLFTYRRIMQRIREKYPSSKMLIASWDFIGWWKPEEVQKLMKEFDPERTIILDYTSEHDDPDISFMKWGVVGKMPWIFGLFHAFESQNCLRGMYDVTKARLEVAKEDPFCKGMIFWPELSHSDTLVLEYLARNSWKPDQMSVEPLAERFSMERYGEFGSQMNTAWQAYLPLIKLVGWGHFTRRTPDDPDYHKYCHAGQENKNVLNNVLGGWDISVYMHEDEDISCEFDRWNYLLNIAHSNRENIPVILNTLCTLPDEALDDPFVKRDLMDIAHSLMEQIMHYGMLRLLMMCEEFRQGADNGAVITQQCESIFNACAALGELLACHEDYSMNATMDGLKKVSPVNPLFEPTLKHNLVNGYCRQAAYEPWNFLYMAEQKVYFDWIKNNVAANVHNEWDRDVLTKAAKTLFDEFMDKPLDEMRPIAVDVRPILAQAVGFLMKIEL